MSSNLRDDPAAHSMRDLEKRAKQQGSLRQQAERQAFNGPRRWRRKSGRTEFVAIRTFPEIRQMIADMADEQQKHLGEIVEDAVKLLREQTKDEAKRNG